MPIAPEFDVKIDPVWSKYKQEIIDEANALTTPYTLSGERFAEALSRFDFYRNRPALIDIANIGVAYLELSIYYELKKIEPDNITKRILIRAANLKVEDIIDEMLITDPNSYPLYRPFLDWTTSELRTLDEMIEWPNKKIPFAKSVCETLFIGINKSFPTELRQSLQTHFPSREIRSEFIRDQQKR